MKIRIAVCVTTLVIGGFHTLGQDISKEEQQKLLDRFVGKLHKAEGSYPMSISTWVKKCEMKWDGGSAKELDLAEALKKLPNPTEQTQKNYRLTAMRKEFRKGEKDAPWNAYGVVRPADNPNTVWLQYFVFFGWNEPEVASSKADKVISVLGGGDPDPGQHEGDWLSYALKVDRSNPAAPKLVDIIVWNHGRTVFADDPFAEGRVGKTGDETGEHCNLYLEDGTNEPWSFKGDGDGFAGKVPDWVWTSHFLSHEDAGLGWLEKVDWLGAEKRAVRGHASEALKLKPAKVVNVGLEAAFNNEPEAQFFHRFAGAYGEEHSKGGECPKGPPFQGNSMWHWDKISRERAKK